MNAASQRRLTPWLAGMCVLLGLLWASLLSGLGQHFQHVSKATPPPLPDMHQATTVDKPPALTQFVEVWQRPLLSMDRKPIPVASGDHGANIDQLVLTGVILTPDMRMALLTSGTDGHTVRVREGAHVADSNWVLKTLQPRQAQFINNGQVIRLALKVQAGTSTTPTTTSPAPGTQNGQ